MQYKYKEHHTQAPHSQRAKNHSERKSEGQGKVKEKERDRESQRDRETGILKAAREQVTQNIDLNIIIHFHLIGICTILNPLTTAAKLF